LSEFQAAGAEVVGVSIDSKFCHKAWMESPRNKGGIGGLNIPLLADINKTMSRDYGVLLEGPGIALRGTFIIDNDGVVQAEGVNNTAIGRDVDDILRTLNAAKESKTGVVCPMNWKKGKDAINPKEAAKYFEKNAK
jgi:alkyl hydroperoxide reductase subunit AhpC